MVRDLSSERRSMLQELPAELAARVERNRIWMDTFGGDRGMAALTNANEEEKEEVEEAKVSEIILVQEENNPPTSPEWDDQDPDDVQQEPPVDPMYCQFCLITPCLFLQWQEEVERDEALMYPAETNKAKRFIFYRRMTRRLYGHLGKGIHKPLPHCFVQGARDLYPNGEAEGVYTGFKQGRDGNGFFNKV